MARCDWIHLPAATLNRGQRHGIRQSAFRNLIISYSGTVKAQRKRSVHPRTRLIVCYKPCTLHNHPNRPSFIAIVCFCCNCGKRHPLDMQRTPLQSFSTTEALDLLRQGSGSAYFVPSGYIPILVPDNDEDPDFIRRLLDTHVPTQVPVDNLWQTRLPTKVMRPKRKRPERAGPAKKPPRPPNAFILYRKDKQVLILFHSKQC
jgi:hypothetical protein